MSRPIGQPSDAYEAPGSDPFDLAWVLDARADAAEIDAGVSALLTGVAASANATADLLRAIRFIDLTTLSGDDTPGRVRALCAQAREPLPAPLAARLGEAGEGARVAAVCVYHHFLETAQRSLEGSRIPVAVAAGGFPAGLSARRQRIEEVRSAAGEGAGEVDVVINRSLALTGEWEALYAEVAAFREAAGSAPLKVILATGDLASLDNVARAARVCLQAGADFIKTSTGKETLNATFPAGLVMLREIVRYHERTGREAGFKPAGGIRTPEQALGWMRLVEGTTGPGWLRPERFRIGASGLLGAIAGRLESPMGGEPVDAPRKGAAAEPSGY